MQTTDNFVGVNENNVSPSPGLYVSGTPDEIAALNNYSQQIANLEQRVTTIEQKIKSFHDAMTTKTSS